MSNSTGSQTNLLRSKQVVPLPVGPGGNNPTKQQMNATNTQLTMMAAQAAANTKYDPPVPQPITSQVTVEQFCALTSIASMSSVSGMLWVVGGLMIVYGIIAK